MAAVEQDRWLAHLTGVRASKPTYYPEYRRTSAGLDRALAALEAASGALCMTTRGTVPLIRAFLDAVHQQFLPQLALLALRPEAFGGVVPPLVTQDGAEVPSAARALVGALLAGEDLERSSAWLATRLWRGEQAVGALVVWRPAVQCVDDSDLAILAALGNQALTAIDNALLFEESEQLRVRIAAVYRDAQHHARDLEERSAELRAVQGHLVEARERCLLDAERQRIARELHDSVAQHLLSIGMHLEWSRPLAAATPELHERLALAKGLARDAVGRIREAIFTLSEGEEAERALERALGELATLTTGTSGVGVRVRVRGETPHLPLPVTHGLTRIAQEAVSNAVRHAGASRVDLALRVDDERAVLTVTDDGDGDAAALRRALQAERSGGGRHRGLGNMDARARELGGTLTLRRARGGGITLRATIPL